MQFKVDENLPLEVAQRLRQAGFNATTVVEEDLVGAKDSIVADVCRAECRALVTLDLDFADIRAYPPERFTGLIVIRLARQDKNSVLAVIDRLVPMLSSAELDKCLWIVGDTQIRIRGGDE